MGRVSADETVLLSLYREWESSSSIEKRGHGNKFNGDVYYGAFRGHTHIDCGGTMTVLLGPGDLRDRIGNAADETTNALELGGNLMVAMPGEEKLVSLPYRLPCGSPYVVVFFEKKWESSLVSQTSLDTASDRDGASRKDLLSRKLRRDMAIDTDILGWAPTVHGVRRIENQDFSRSQTVIHMVVTEDDLTK